MAAISNWQLKRSIRRRYDVTAGIYDIRYAEEQNAKYAAALAKVCVLGAVLDVGCGSGLLFRYVVERADLVVGVDLSSALLQHAKKRAKSFLSVHLVQADADYLPFRKAFFSVVFAFTVLQNMPKPAETIAELKRVAINGGSIVVTALKKSFSTDAFKALLQKAGLAVVSFEDDPFLKCYVAIAI